MAFTIATTGHGPHTIRQAGLTIRNEGWFVGKEFRVIGRTKPVVTFGAGLDYKRFDLQIRVHSKTEHDNVMAVLRNGTSITVTTHQSDTFTVAVVGQIEATSILAAPTTGEPYPTRYAWDINCEVVEV